MPRFQDKVVLITGASSGIGEALAREFVREGAAVAVTARRVDRLRALETDLKKQGGRALALACDVTQDGQVEAALDKARQTFGRIDVVVANAGFGVIGKIDKLSLEDFRRQFETNVFGVLRTVLASVNDLIQNKGQLVLMGSVSGHLSAPEASPYSMSKFAVHALAEALYSELGAKGVAVTLISPGFVATEIHKVNNLGEFREDLKPPVPAWITMPADQAARKMLRAIYRKKREQVITCHGKAFVFLNRLFPGLIPRLFRRFGRKVRRGGPRP